MDATGRRLHRARWIVHGLAPILIGVPGLGYSGVALLSAHLLTESSNVPSPVDPAVVGPDARPWRVCTADGLTLRGWYFPTPARWHLVVCVHGMKMNWAELAGVGRDLHRRGYDVLLFDLRGHGRSDPSRLTMGRRERRDLRAVLAWARRQGFAPARVGWLGASMGAATVLMEGASNPDIRAAVLDSPFGNLPELLDRQLSQHSGLPQWFNPGILLAARLAFGVRTDDLVPLRLAPLWRDRPLLLIHGTADSIIPVRQSQLIARAAGPMCQAILVPGVEHVGAYQEDPFGYVEAVDRFFAEHLGP